jgi:RTX calcium-binding nonapeptide repeat (4 copies)
VKASTVITRQEPGCMGSMYVLTPSMPSTMTTPYGGAGDDYIDGGLGTDSCDGGPGFDTCVNCEVKINYEN